MLILESGFSFWNPIIWIIVFIVVAAIAYYLRRQGQKAYKKGTGQTKVFLCGEEEPAAEQQHVRAHNIYWGFFEALKGYYETNMKAHTGIINDFMILFVAVIAICSVIIIAVG